MTHIYERAKLVPLLLLSTMVVASCSVGSKALKTPSRPNKNVPNVADVVQSKVVAGAISAIATGAHVGGEAAATSCSPQASATPLLRLTRQQYTNSVADLLQLAVADLPNLVLPADDSVGPFSANTTTQIGSVDAYYYQQAATVLSQKALANKFAKLLPCDFAAMDVACVNSFITSFGANAFRRPLTVDEISVFAALASAYVKAGAYGDAARLVISAVLQSPDFIYRPEYGLASDPTVLSPYELATRLSYALWNTTPDAALLKAANANQLDAAAVKAHANRLIGAERFGGNAANMIGQLLEIQGLTSETKDGGTFPKWSPTLAQALAQEAIDFTSYVFTKGDARFETLFTANYSVPSKLLFDYYGTATPANWTYGQTVPFSSESGRSGGLLTQGAFLAAHAHPTSTNVVERGFIVRRNLLCSTPPPPPAVSPLPETAPGFQTIREKFAQHESNPSCAACHTLMDPIGLSFEHYDGTGVFRAMDAGLPIDASGTLKSPAFSQQFSDAAGLAGALSKNSDAYNCVVLQTYRYMASRPEVAADSCSLKQLGASFAASNHDLRALMLAIVTAPTFAQRGQLP